VFSSSVEAEAAELYAHRKRIDNQRKELIQLLRYAYGNEGVEEYRKCMKEVQEQRKREVYAQQEAKDALVKSVWIAILAAVAGYIIWIIVQAITGRA